MRRRLLLLAAVAAPFVAAAAVSAHGCSSDPPFESVCLWVSDPDNCFREFREDMLAQRGVWNDNPNGDCSPVADPTQPANPFPTQANSDPNNLPGISNGSFATRMQLDNCILNAGGTVVFNPALSLTPPGPFDQPTTYQITISAADANVCGVISYTSPHGFSITINGPPDAGGGSGGSGGASTTTVNTVVTDTSDVDAAIGDIRIPYGTYTEVNTPGRDNMDVTCPSGEFHHFNLNELTPGATRCQAFLDFVPTASLQIFPGGTDAPGAVSLAITYPPVDNADGGSFPEDASAPTVPTKPVVYFNCQIPAGAELCLDGTKDGAETDIDCGGPPHPSPALDGGSCPARCEVGQMCLRDSDCDTAAGLTCLVNAMSGMRTCQAPITDAGPG